MNTQSLMACTWLLMTLLAPGFVEPAPAFATRVGPDLVVECPRCTEPVRQRARVMIAPKKTRIWTDGWRESYLQTNRPWLLRCPHCDVLFWIDEGRPLRRLASVFERIEWLEAEDATWPDADDYQRVLDEPSLDEEREIYLRQQLWWLANHPWRDLEGHQSAKLGERQRRNLTALYGLLEPSTVKLRLMKAEVARELGLFDEALDLLRDWTDWRSTRLASKIAALAKQQISAVRELR